MVLILPRVPLIVSHPLTRPDDLGVTHEASCQTNPRKPHHHCRFSRRRDLLAAAEQREGLCGIRVRFPPLPGLSAQTQSPLSRRWMPHPSFALCAGPSGWSHHLADTVHDVSCGVHDPPALYLTL